MEVGGGGGRREVGGGGEEGQQQKNSMVYYESCLGKTPKLTRKEQLVQKPKSKMNNKYQIHVQMVTQVTNMPLYTSSTVAIFHKLLNLKTVNILCVTQLEIFV